MKPASPKARVKICDGLFDSTTNGLLMTDGAVCYKSGHPGIKDHYTVCHNTRPPGPLEAPHGLPGGAASHEFQAPQKR